MIYNIEDFGSVYIALFDNALVATVEETELPIDEECLQSTVRLSNLNERQLFFFERLSVRGILAEALPKCVGFNDDQFWPWCESAHRFFSENHRNERFVDLFSSDLNYETILSYSLTVESEADLISIIERDTGLSYNGAINNRLTEDMQGMLLQIADQALLPSLRDFALMLKKQSSGSKEINRKRYDAIRDMTHNRSFRDQKGSLPFVEAAGRLTVRPEAPATKMQAYRSLVERALLHLRAQDVTRRIGNRDALLARYIREFEEVFSAKETEESALIIHMVASNLSSRLAYNVDKAAEDEKIEGDSISAINALIAAAGAYVQGFKAVETLLADMDRAASSFKSGDASVPTASLSVMIQLSGADTIFSEDTAKLLGRLADALSLTCESAGPGKSAQPSNGLIGIGVGTLRGSIRAMGGAVVESALEESKDLTRVAVKEAVSEL